MSKIYTGWSYRGRPFSPSQYKNSYLRKKRKNKSYSSYLKEYARQYKIPYYRKTL